MGNPEGEKEHHEDLLFPEAREILSPEEREVLMGIILKAQKTVRPDKVAELIKKFEEEEGEGEK